MRWNLLFTAVVLCVLLPCGAPLPADVITDGNMYARVENSYGGMADISWDGGVDDDLALSQWSFANTAGAAIAGANYWLPTECLTCVGATGTSTMQLNESGAAVLGLPTAGLVVSFTHVINDVEDSFASRVTVRNATDASQSLSVYGYWDLNVDAANWDTATGSPTGIFFSGAGQVRRFTPIGTASHFEIDTTVGFPNIRTRFTGMSSQTDLLDQWLPCGPGPLAGVYQFDLNLAAGESATVGVTLVPEPASALLAALTVAGMWRMRRRRRGH